MYHLCTLTAYISVRRQVFVAEGRGSAMRSGNRGVWPFVAGGWVLAALLVLVGTSDAGPLPAVRDLLPAGSAEPVALAGFGFAAVALSITALVVAAKVTAFLLALAFRGGDALDRLPDVDPLLGGTIGIVVIGGIVLGAGALLTADVGGAGDVPYLDEALGDDGPQNAHGIVADDELEGFGTTGGSLPEYRDTDGDRLPDSWERAGETPEGVPLPGADPDRKDLYVQVNYANGHPPLNDSERRQLKETWASMPVDNPDGETGVTVHVVDEAPAGGPIDDRVELDEDGISESFARTYYNVTYLGERDCSHYMVVFGDVDGVYAGWGFTPGYLSVVDGGERGSAAGTSQRVRVMTHELLHNVVGQIGTGDTHVDRGWLAGADGEFEPRMSDPVSGDLNRSGFARSAGFETELCDRPVGAGEDDGG
jgi:hypothetical protein